jgi:hypothetical protein
MSARAAEAAEKGKKTILKQGVGKFPSAPEYCS